MQISVSVCCYTCKSNLSEDNFKFIGNKISSVIISTLSIDKLAEVTIKEEYSIAEHQDNADPDLFETEYSSDEP